MSSSFFFAGVDEVKSERGLKEETIDPLDLDGPFRCEVETCLEVLKVRSECYSAEPLKFSRSGSPLSIFLVGDVNLNCLIRLVCCNCCSCRLKFFEHCQIA